MKEIITRTWIGLGEKRQHYQLLNLQRFLSSAGHLRGSRARGTLQRTSAKDNER